MSWTVVTATRPIYTVFDSAGLSACHEAVVSLPEDIVDAAERGDWDEVGLLKREYIAHIERPGHGLRPVLPYEEVQCKRDLIICILINDAHVRVLVYLHQDELTCLVSRKRRAVGAYQAYAAASYH